MTAPPLLAWASDHFTLDLPEGHPFPIAKYRLTRERLLAEGVLRPEWITPSQPAPREWLDAAHDPAYVTRTLDGHWTDAEIRKLGLPWSHGLVQRARAAVYGTVHAARAALEHGIAGNLAGGTHHAFRDRGEAYCLFNDIAITITLLRGERRIARPFVLDLDVHQGNGTAAMFAGDPDVFTFSMHARHNYPTRKETSTLDVELDDHAEDDAVLAALDAHVPRALDAHAPDLVIYQAGVDALHTDRLGRLRMTHAGLAERDRRVFAWARERRVPIVFLLGGGYGRPIESTVEASAALWKEALAARRAWPAPARRGTPDAGASAPGPSGR